MESRAGAPDRYPLNRKSRVFVNVLAAYPSYILPVIFPKIIWLGLAQIWFGLAGQLIVHGIVINRKMHSFYNPGLAVTVFLHLPIGLYYISYVHAHGLIQPWHWRLGCVCSVAAMIVAVALPVRIMRDRNWRYPFDPEEMERFHVREKLEKLATR